MAKIVLNDITNTRQVSVINNNMDKIESEFQEKVLYRDNPSGEPNDMKNSLDMNNNRILNLPEPVNGNEAARLRDVQEAVSGANANLIKFSPTGDLISDNVQAAIVEAYTKGKQYTDVLSTSLMSPSGSNLVGFLNSTVYDKLLGIVSVLDYIPESEHAAIKNYTSTYDATDAFNQALGDNKVVRVPSGGYLTTRPINMTSRRDGLGEYTGRSLIGEGAHNTRINSYTGNYPCIDLTGSSNCTIVGINFRSDNPPSGFTGSDCASIGIVLRRGSSSVFTNNCHQPRLIDLRFNLTSDVTRNGNTGTIGILCIGSEHIVTDHVQIYANLPLVAHNSLQFVVSESSNIPTYGVEYEVGYTGVPISTTIAEWRSLQLVSYDSFRAMWLNQVANYEFQALYTGTRKLVSNIPIYDETFFMTSVANVKIMCYQEVSGAFSGTYRMDHRYLTLSGDNNNIYMDVQRGALDVGFDIPGAPESSVHLLNNTRLANSRINCNYTIGIYNLTSDNNGFAVDPVTVTGVPNSILNTEFILDKLGHGSNIFNTIGPYCTNVNFVNYYTGDSYWGSGQGTFTPSVVGGTLAGTATYTKQIGSWVRNGRVLTFWIELAYTGHTGTEFMQIEGIPFAPEGYKTPLSVEYDGLLVGAGKQLNAFVDSPTQTIYLEAADSTGGARTILPIDANVSSLMISGTYKLA